MGIFWYWISLSLEDFEIKNFVIFLGGVCMLLVFFLGTNLLQKILKRRIVLLLL